jgi:hypothetical protein
MKRRARVCSTTVTRTTFAESTIKILIHARPAILLRREILTLGEGFNTQVITLWCFYIVGREILTLGEGFNTQVITLWCFYIVSWILACECVCGDSCHLASFGVDHDAQAGGLHVHVQRQSPTRRGTYVRDGAARPK